MNIFELIENRKVCNEIDRIPSVAGRVRAEKIRLRLARLVVVRAKIAGQLTNLHAQYKTRLPRYCDMLERYQSVNSAVQLMTAELRKGRA